MIRITNDAARVLLASLLTRPDSRSVPELLRDTMALRESGSAVAAQVIDEGWEGDCTLQAAMGEIQGQLQQQTFPGTVSVLERIADIIRGPWTQSYSRATLSAIRQALWEPSELERLRQQALTCASCGRPIGRGEAVTYMPASRSEGGLFCTTCRAPETHACSSVRCHEKVTFRQSRMFERSCTHRAEQTTSVPINEFISPTSLRERAARIDLSQLLSSTPEDLR